MANLAEKQELETADIARIMEILPHRYPFLMIDRIIEMNQDISGIGIKNVTVNEPFFVGHFPNNPVMPGVLMVEAMAQTAGALVSNYLGASSDDDYIVYFMTIDKARFRRPVGPGDTLYFPVHQVRKRANVWKFRCEARVNDQLVAEAEITAMIAPSTPS